jgi:hypothetical protein
MPALYQFHLPGAPRRDDAASDILVSFASFRLGRNVSFREFPTFEELFRNPSAADCVSRTE